MTKKGLDRRVQRTRQGLQEALVTLILEKGYEAVTIQDVIDRANVGRATFYAHFSDKENLLLSEFENLDAEFEQHVASQTMDNTLWSFSTVMFRHAQSYHRIYKAVIGKQSGYIMRSHIQNYLTNFIREYLKTRWSTSKKEIVPLEVLAQYLASSLIALMTWWLDRDLPYSAERMDEIYQQLAKPGVDLIFQSMEVSPTTHKQS
jgi:AcrR family transcriptional regulator